MSFTQVSNHFIDNDMNALSASATVVYIAICRKTAGWHKQYDEISLSQFVALTGLSKPTILRALIELESRGIINTQKNARQSSSYAVSATIMIERACCGDEPAAAVSPAVASQNILLPDIDDGKNILPPVVKNVYQQKKQQNKQQNKQRDTRLNDWQFTVYRQLTHLNVPFAFRDAVAKLTCETCWTRAITKWIGRGYRPTGIQGMLEWYQKECESEDKRGRQNGQNDGRQSSIQDYIAANQHFIE